MFNDFFGSFPGREGTESALRVSAKGAVSPAQLPIPDRDEPSSWWSKSYQAASSNHNRIYNRSSQGCEAEPM